MYWYATVRFYGIGLGTLVGVGNDLVELQLNIYASWKATMSLSLTSSLLMMIELKSTNEFLL